MIKNAKIYGKFYSPEKIMSYNRHLMIILGSRNIGKSTAIALVVLMDYIKYGRMFIYSRRDEITINKTCRTFFDSAVKILNRFGYNIAQFYYYSGDYFIRIKGQEQPVKCGTTVPLSMEEKFKSTNFEAYWNIIYDEFITKDKSKYLGTQKNFTFEYDCLISLYQTVDRGIDTAFRNETKMYLLGNIASYFNPVFLALGINNYIRTDSKIIAPKGEEWIVEQVGEVEATKEYKQSVAYKLSTEKVKNYAYENTAFDYDEKFITKYNGPLRALINISFNGHKMGIYHAKNEDIIYINNDVAENFETISLSIGDHSEINNNLILKYTDHPIMKKIKMYYTSGRLLFRDNKCKYDMLNYMMLTK